MLNQLPKIFTVLAVSMLPGGATVISLVPGAARTDDPVTGENDWTLDAGYFASGSNAVIFEAGGDGTGTALVVSGGNLTVYQDRGDFLNPSPADDTVFSIDISGFAGKVISIRLDADLSTATDTLTLTATDGISTVSDLRVLPGDVGSIAGGNNTGFGLTAEDLAGLDESGDLAQFNDPSYKPGGANVLDASELGGELYINEPAPGAIPAPSTWGLVPEPGSTLLIALAGVIVGMRRRR